MCELLNNGSLYFLYVTLGIAAILWGLSKL